MKKLNDPDGLPLSELEPFDWGEGSGSLSEDYKKELYGRHEGF